MPLIRVEMFVGRTLEQKRALTRELTEAAMRALGVGAQSVDVMIFEVERQHWGTGGTLNSDKPPAGPPPVAG